MDFLFMNPDILDLEGKTDAHHQLKTHETTNSNVGCFWQPGDMNSVLVITSICK